MFPSVWHETYDDDGMDRGAGGRRLKEVHEIAFGTNQFHGLS